MTTDGSNEVNPYEPPSVDVNVSKPAPLLPPSEAPLAERGTRLVARMLDGLLALALMLPVLIPGLRAAGRPLPGAAGNLALFSRFFSSGLGILSGAACLALAGFQAYLIATTGQSIGKRWFKIKIVRLDGSRVNFLTGVLLRQWLFAFLQYIPGVGPLAGFLDPLFIFRADRRCIHDFTAGTRVIQLGEGNRQT